MSNITALV